MSVQLTMIAIMMMMCCTCLHVSAVSLQETVQMTACVTESEMFVSMTELDKIIAEKVADVMRAARQETEQLRADVEGLNAKLQGQNAFNEKLQLEIVGVKKENILMKKHVEGQGYINEELKQQVENLIAHPPRHDDDADQVAFSVASHSEFGPVGVDTNIDYEIVYSNIGGDWSSVSDAFHCSVDGFYMFTASMKSSASSPANMWVHIVHSHEAGQTRVASMFGHNEEEDGDGDGDANVVILELLQGDIVSVQLEAGNGFLASSPDYVYSTFSGFLLFS